VGGGLFWFLLVFLGFCGLALVFPCILPVYLGAPYAFFNKVFLLIKKKKKKNFFLPKAANIPLNNSILSNQVFCHHRIFIPHNTKQIWKTLLQRSLPTPPIMSETYMRPIPNLKTNKVAKLIPPPPNMFPHTHPKSTQHLF
jgi:hypothetical protein